MGIINRCHTMDEAFRVPFQDRLLEWYRAHRRGLPWREKRDPYWVWISELMLQQTRVEQMLPYFERFMQVFPDVETLARAPMDQVLKVWEGMGYYARARNMHRAAQRMVQAYGGRIPDTMEEILKLPGIGPYTAAAVLSIAYDKDYAVLDGNVMRVLCRVFYVEEDPKRNAVRKELLEVAGHLLPPGQAAMFNQAMMELGSLVCTPKAPKCPICPTRELCMARHAGNPERLPAKTRRKPKPHYDVSAGIIWGDGQILITQRRPEGLLGGLWEFPGGKQEPGESMEACLQREVQEELGIDLRVDRFFMRVKHAYSHFRVTLHVFQCTYLEGKPRAIECADWRWVYPQELDQYAFPRADRRVLEKLLGKEEGSQLQLGLEA